MHHGSDLLGAAQQCFEEQITLSITKSRLVVSPESLSDSDSHKARKHGSCIHHLLTASFPLGTSNLMNASSLSATWTRESMENLITRLSRRCVPQST
eukprot:3589233-Rhodomonas_salina.1